MSTNIKVPKMTGKPHIGCMSHKPNLEARSMIERHYELRNVIESIHRTMKEVKTKSKSAAILRNLTELRPILDNATQWCGKVTMLKRFLDVREEIFEEQFGVDGSSVFAWIFSRGRTRAQHWKVGALSEPKSNVATAV